MAGNTPGCRPGVSGANAGLVAGRAPAASTLTSALTRAGSFIQPSDPLVAEVYVPDTVDLRWPQAYPMAVKRPPDDVHLAAKMKLALALHLTSLVARTVLHRRQRLGVRTRADRIATHRYVQIQRLMGAMQVVRSTPLIKRGLTR